MDDWLDAFRELYRLEIQERKQGVISKRRKRSIGGSDSLSNIGRDIVRRPPSPPPKHSRKHSRRDSRGNSKRTKSNRRSISPTPSNTQASFGGVLSDEEKQSAKSIHSKEPKSAKSLRRRNRSNGGIAEAGTFANSQMNGFHTAQPLRMDLARSVSGSKSKEESKSRSKESGSRRSRSRSQSTGRRKPPKPKRDG